jgi:hypothetical protein
MRIDFAASYKEVSKLLRASAGQTPTAGPNDFERSLGALVRSPSQPPDLQKNLPTGQATEPALSPSDGDVRASYRFTEPELELPFVAPQQTQEVPDIKPTDPQPSVKTPAVLDVKRVDLAGEPTSKTNSIAINRAEVEDLLKKAGDRFEINPKLAMAVVKSESDFNPRAVSSDGHASKGLFQLLDTTGRGLLARGENPDRKYDPFNPELNVELGTSYLKYLHDIFSKETKLPNDHSTRPAADTSSLEKLAVAAFNAGEGRVASAQTRAQREGKDPTRYDHVEPYLPASTRDYVTRVIDRKKLF